ncbi:MAG: zinc ribbon domain-containing protein [Anaerolineales bacterium]|nr:zinc ribbon domain-containing protein [Anaerolineales bacterium]
MDFLYSSNLLFNLSLYFTALTGACLAALWISLIFWTYRDIRTRTRDRLIHIVASVMVGVLYFPGLLVYLILRPAETLDHAYYKTLEEEALLSSIEHRPNCPGCGAQTNREWYYCPLCYTRLGKQCGDCGRKMELSWQLCPYCGTAVPSSRARIKHVHEEEPSPSPDDENSTLTDREINIPEI